ncbi:MAG: metal-sensitive transcriptional regulator [Candidatus Microsaccharimonas sp.]
MTHGYVNQKPELTKRLNRIEGQVRGVAKMIDQDTYCIDVLTQVSAIRAALDKVSLELLRDHAHHCLTNDGTLPEGREDKADELVSAIARML